MTAPFPFAGVVGAWKQWPEFGTVHLVSKLGLALHVKWRQDPTEMVGPEATAL